MPATISGLKYQENIQIPHTAPGDVLDLSLEIETPQEYGYCQTVFNLTHEGKSFGPDLKLDLLIFVFAAWPTDYKKITQPFGANPQLYAQFGMPGHEGVDIMAPLSSPIYAVADGEVTHVAQGEDTHRYGLHVRITHPNGFETIYGHLEQAIVQTGQRVLAGEQIGLSGSSGLAAGAHLHLSLRASEVKDNNWPDGFVNPTQFLLPLLNWKRPDGPYVSGWIHSSVLQVHNDLAQLLSSDIALRQDPNINAQSMGQISEEIIVIITGQPEGTFLPVQVPEKDIHLEAPTSEDEKAQQAGWVLTNSIDISDDQATVGPSGVHLLNNVSRSSDIVGFLMAGSQITVSTPTQGAYTAVNVDPEILQPPLPPATKEVRIGLHASADPAISHGEIAEFRDLRPTIIKILSFHNPADIARLAEDHPNASWIVRIFLAFGGRNISPRQFFNDTIENTQHIISVLSGRDVLLELHNEPNLSMEGLGSSWTDGASFAKWWLELLALYRESLPGMRYLYPGLSPGTAVSSFKADAVQFLLQSQEAVAAADGLGLHLYWSNVYPMEWALATLDSAIYRFPNKPIWITEASNNKGGVSTTAKARQYIDFWQALHRRPNVEGVTYFVASATDPAFAQEVWVGRGIGRLVGQRPPSPLATLIDNAKFLEDVTIPDDIEMQPGQEFVKTWLVQNSGNTSWNESYSLVLTGGEAMASPIRVPLPAAEPGQRVEISINQVAPDEPGTHYGDWRLHNAQNEPFGDVIFLRIVIPEEFHVDGAKFLKDMTIPDDVEMQPGQEFVKTWLVQNSGSTSWNESYSLVLTGGEAMGSPIRVPLPAAEPGQQVEISINQVAPQEAGSHYSDWRLHNAQNEPFGDVIFLRIVIPEESNRSEPDTEYNYLFQAINDNYTTNELHELFLSLGLNYDDFGGSNKRRKAQELQSYMERRRRLDELMAQIHQDRPFLDLRPFGGPRPEDTKDTEDTAPPSVSTIPTTGSTSTYAPKSDPNYENFDIHIRPGRTEGEYALSATSLAGQTDQISQSLPVDEAYEDQIYYLRELMATPDDVHKLGHSLHEFLFPDAIHNLYRGTRARANEQGKAGVRIRIITSIESRQLSQIPWEVVRDDRTFMALNENTPIIRYMPTNRPPNEIYAPEKVRILIAWASPADQALLDVEK